MTGRSIKDFSVCAKKTRELFRDDIVGRSVRQIYRSGWQVDDDGYAGCSIFVELDNGVLFELQSNASLSNVAPLVTVERSQSDLFVVEKDINDNCKGKTIKEVIVSEYWLGIGLLLIDGNVLFTGETFAKRVGACVSNSQLKQDFRVNEFVPYWRS